MHFLQTPTTTGDATSANTPSVIDVRFPTEGDEHWPPVASEMISCESISEGVARLRDIPLYAPDLSRGDIVRIRTAPDGPMFAGVEMRGGNTTVHLRAATAELVADAARDVVEAGASVASSPAELLLAIDVPGHVPLDEVLGRLEARLSLYCTYTVSCRQHVSWRTLASELNGRVVTPADDAWDEARTAWNLAVDQRPAAVVFPTDEADVATVLRFARRHRITVAPQGGGHNPAPLGDLAGTILLRMSELKQVTVLDGAVRCEAGVLWGEVSAALRGRGVAALAGSSHDVGVVGYALSGGYSWMARRYGLGANSIVEIEVVTGDGVARRVDAEHEPELFWALRGGGGNHGVVTALTFRTFPVAEVYAGSLLFPIERAEEVFAAFASWTADLDESVTSCVRLLRLPPLPDLPEFLRGQSFAAVDGAVVGNEKHGREMLAPLRALGPAVDLFTMMPATELDQIHMDPPQPVPGAGDGQILDELSADTIDAIMSVVGPGCETSLLAVDIRHLGGAAGRPDPSGGAVDHFPGRYLAFGVGIVMGPESEIAIRGDIEVLLTALAPWSNAKTYANFSESSSPAARFHDPETLARLVELRRHYDPAGVVRANHPID